jgi:cell division protein ZapE
MTPLERYRAELARDGFEHDPKQEAVVHELQRIYEEFMARPQDRGGLFKHLRFTSRARAAPPVRGLYLWGGVGRGKTHLVNEFYKSLAFPEKLRVHFHLFMQDLHGELKKLPATPDPVPLVAESLALRANILCLDEFHVTDITDAMLLGRLLTALFERGVTLVTTSNIPPDELYRDGLQRERFIPAIELIKENTRVICLDGDEDYRLRYLEHAEIYHSPLDAGADSSLRESFQGLRPEGVVEAGAIEIEGRPIQAVRYADGIAWFEFRTLCDEPRGTIDYIEISRCFHTVFIANIPKMGDDDKDKAARFIRLVDVLYDHNVNLVVSADAVPSDLYISRSPLAFDFTRTQSRLEEMRSHDYLARSHLP